MGAPVLNGPFTMPMFRDFVPRALQPWIYIFMAATFQLSGGIYLGALNEMIGGMALMREDLMMCLYANLAGMAIYFPILFRMKFRFTNRTLLTAAAAGALVCNLVAPHVRLLPLLWAVCFVEGMCKIQGTFECMSTIQLWITPQRDFTAFFPVLHIVILGCMQLSTIITTALMHHYHWVWMHLLVSALMAVDLLIVRLCTRHFRIVRKMPLYGIDWLGALLWVALLLQVAYLFDYGEWYDWWYSPVMRRLAVTSVATLALCLWRMNTIRHPYIEPRMWSYRHLFPILILITLVEMLLATEHVLEGAFYEQTMHYDATVSVLVTRWVLVGVLAGCGFAYWWMHVRRMSYVRLLTVGIAALAAYLLGYYFTVSADIHVSQLYLPAACRGFAYAILSATFMVCLEEIMTFQHFFQELSVFNMLHMVVGGGHRRGHLYRGLHILYGRQHGALRRRRRQRGLHARTLRHGGLHGGLRGPYDRDERQAGLRVGCLRLHRAAVAVPALRRACAPRIEAHTHVADGALGCGALAAPYRRAPLGGRSDGTTKAGTRKGSGLFGLAPADGYFLKYLSAKSMNRCQS